MVAITRQVTIQVPGDKSISHRSLIFGALGNGRSRVRNILMSADLLATASVLRTLGVSIDELSDDIYIEGRGLGGLTEPSDVLNCENSGTTARLMSGVLAAYPFASTIAGDASLSQRPMRRVTDPLGEMGADFSFLEREGFLPMTIRGANLKSVTWRSEFASAQVKSAILLAGLVGGVPVEVIEPSLSRDHTERFLRSLGVPVSIEGTTVSLTPVEMIPALDMVVPADPSSAAFLIAAGLLTDNVELRLPNVCLNATRIGFLGAIERMGGRISMEEPREAAGESVGTVVVRPSALKAISAGAEEIPSMVDEIPMLACLAARAEGETVIRGAGELRVKETDRISATVNNLRSIGVEAYELDDGMRIVGSDIPLAGRVTTFGDHRIAMSFGVLGAMPGNNIVIDNPACASVSYPGFWDDLQQVV